MFWEIYFHPGPRCRFQLLSHLLGFEAQGIPAMHSSVPSRHGSNYVSRRTGISAPFFATMPQLTAGTVVLCPKAPSQGRRSKADQITKNPLADAQHAMYCDDGSKQLVCARTVSKRLQQRWASLLYFRLLSFGCIWASSSR